MKMDNLGPLADDLVLQISAHDLISLDVFDTVIPSGCRGAHRCLPTDQAGFDDKPRDVARSPDFGRVPRCFASRRSSWGPRLQKNEVCCRSAREGQRRAKIILKVTCRVALNGQGRQRDFYRPVSGCVERWVDGRSRQQQDADANGEGHSQVVSAHIHWIREPNHHVSIPTII